MHGEQAVIVGPTVCFTCIRDAHILHLLSAQTNLSARLISVNSLSSTSLLNVLILTIFPTNISLLPLRRNSLGPPTCIVRRVLAFVKETHFIKRYNVAELDM